MDKKNLLKLLKESATLEIIREFLKSHGAHHSGNSWDQILDDRLKPALKEGLITETDILGLVRECEEHGRQHVFLYRVADGQKPAGTNPTRMRKALKKMGLEGLLKEPRLVAAPSSLEICDIRETSAPQGGLTVKAVEKREYWTRIGETLTNGVMTRKYRQETERAVNVARIHPDGLVEVRVFRQKNSSDYKGPLREFWDLIDPLIQKKQCSELSLVTAKKHLWDEGESLDGRVELVQQWARNGHGVVNRIMAEDPDVSLAEDEGAIEGMDAFLSHGGQHRASHVTWLAAESPMGKDIQVAISGMPHEFAIGRACREAEYEHVLSDILKFNG